MENKNNNNVDLNFQQEFNLNFILNMAAWPIEVIQLVQDPYIDSRQGCRGQRLFYVVVVLRTFL